MSTQSARNSNERRTGFSSGTQSGSQESQRRGQGDRGRGGRQQSSHEEGYLERGNQQLRDMMEDHEGQTVLVGLALGFGIGLAIGYSMGGSSEPQRWTDRIAAEGVGRRLLERIDSLLPESITNKLG